VTGVVIALGANLGDAHRALQAAVDALPSLGVQLTSVSAVYETDPVGGPEQPVYLNAVAIGRTDEEAHDLLRGLQRIEDAHGRVREVRWGPRTLDLDIISLESVECADETLTVPHPRAAERGFVLIPWLDADPQAVFPDGRRVADLVAALGVAHGVRRTDLRLIPPRADT
jgi:2-amino-4-hydroxy-6-hydroxymethyldihydropteridine diphosphokinase